MKKHFRFAAIALSLSLLLSSCGTAYYGTFNHNLHQTDVVLSQNNYRIVKEVEGEASATYIFGIGGLSKKALRGNASADMRANANLTGAQAIINESVTESVKMIGPIFMKRTIVSKGTVIEFKK